MPLNPPPRSDHGMLFQAIANRVYERIRPHVQLVEKGERRPAPFAGSMRSRAVITAGHGPIGPATAVHSDSALTVRVDLEVADWSTILLIDLLAVVDAAFFPGDGSMQELLRQHARSYTIEPVQTVYDAGDLLDEKRQFQGRAGFTTVAVKGLKSRKL